MKRIFAWIITLLIIVAIVAGLTMALRKAKKQMAAAPVWKPRPSPVETAQVTEGSLSQTIRYLARLEAVATAEIASKISARIITLEADKGDTVANGDLLARLDDRDIRAQIEAMKANVKAGKARLAGARAGAATARSNQSYAKREYDRDNRLFEKKGISASAVEASRNRLDDARGKTTQAEQSIRSMEQEISALNARMAEAEARLSYTEIRADYPGTIQKRYAEVGDMAMPGKAIFGMMDVSSYRLGFDLVQNDLAWVRAGQSVRIQWPVSFPEDRRAGIVARIFPSLESDQTVRAEIDLSCRCPEKLKVGSLVPLEVIVQEGRGLIVPQTALVPIKNSGYLVYAVRDNRLKQVPVQVTLRHGDEVLIRGELASGETVAVGEYLQWVRLHENMEVYK